MLDEHKSGMQMNLSWRIMYSDIYRRMKTYGRQMAHYVEARVVTTAYNAFPAANNAFPALRITTPGDRILLGKFLAEAIIVNVDQMFNVHTR